MDSPSWRRGLGTPGTIENVSKGSPVVDVSSVTSRVLKLWQRRLDGLEISFHHLKQQHVIVSVAPLLLSTFWARMVLSTVAQAFANSLLFINPQLLKTLLKHLRRDEDPDGAKDWRGLFLVLALSLSMLVQSLVYHWSVAQISICGMGIRGVLASMVYRKSLRLASSSRRRFPTGEIMNLVSTDCQKTSDSVHDLVGLWQAPFGIVLAVYFLFHEIGVAAFAGVAVMSLLIPVSVWTTRQSLARQRDLMAAKESRMRLTGEMVSGMKTVKLHAWEPPFVDRIRHARGNEVRLLRAIGKLWTVTTTVSSCSPFLITFVTFGTHSVIEPDKALTAESIFVSIALLSLLRVILQMLLSGMSGTANIAIAIRRIDAFLNAEELDPKSVTGEMMDGDRSAVEIRSLSCGWDDKEKSSSVRLKNVSLNVPKGSLTAIVGAVGSGKSTILSAILGDLRNEHGTVALRGSVAYVPQQAWIKNGTVKSNILMGEVYRNEQYQKVLEACGLKQDLEILGDRMNAGENGAALSGGQRQRVSLARAVYQDSDIYLMDDPLSAVDVCVGKHVFEEVISSERGILREKTRILVTNQVENLHLADQIVVMEGGRVAERGTYRELMEARGHFADFLSQHGRSGPGGKGIVMGSEGTEEPDQSEDTTMDQSGPDRRKTSAEQNRLTDTGSSDNQEAEQTSTVSSSAYRYYLRNLGYSVSALIVFLFLCVQALQAGSRYWLSLWADENDNQRNVKEDTTSFYLTVYAMMLVGNVFLEIVQNLFVYLSTAEASSIIHNDMLEGVVRSPMSFFDTTPIGEVVNRFSGDLGIVDSILPSTLAYLCNYSSKILLTFAMICYALPIFSVVIPLLVSIYVLIHMLYSNPSRQLNRFDGANKSLVYSHLGESLNGAASIRAYKLESDSVNELDERLNAQICSHYHCVSIQGWLAVTVEMLGNVVVLLTSLLTILARRSITPGLAGVIITYAMDVTFIFNYFIRTVCDVEANSVSVERILEFANSESESDCENDADLGKDWPSLGRVEFQHYGTRYRHGIDLALKDVSVHIEPGWRVGICGRTGAGKSSLALGLFRIVEPAEGRVLVDHVDTREVGLKRLRSSMTIIPQDPVLFAGTLRFNLDPDGSRTDRDIWTSLEHCGLRDLVSPQGLDHEVSERGGNFSSGQRQLVCLARALLRRSRILVLDEATASVDLETDRLVQGIIRREFRGCTVIVIAHRLETVVDCDRVAVFDDGRLVEFGVPAQLLKDENTEFVKLARHSV